MGQDGRGQFAPSSGFVLKVWCLQAAASDGLAGEGGTVTVRVLHIERIDWEGLRLIAVGDRPPDSDWLSCEPPVIGRLRRVAAWRARLHRIDGY